MIGTVSDITGSLTFGILMGPAAILIGGIILLGGASALAADQIKLQQQTDEALARSRSVAHSP